MNRLREKYQTTIIEQLTSELKVTNKMAVPKLVKVVVSMGITKPADAKEREKLMGNINDQFETITGQHPVITRAKKAISNFGLRMNDPVGMSVTLRGEKMWQFMDKLISIALPRVKDFQGVSRTAFDGQGNYSLGLEEQIIFPEIDYDKIESIRGLQINVITSTKDNQAAFRLLELLGMPFAKETTEK